MALHGGFFITGELGEGKTLCAVGRIRDYLKRGRPVATNINLNLEYLVGRNNTTSRVYRLPDHPTKDDFLIIGRGNKTKDENLNGLVVLDELGTWLNARTWNDKNRQALLAFFLHIRKRGWDILLLVQDIDLIDKQARVSIAKYHCKCSRTDNWNIPFIGFFFQLIFRDKLPFPKMFLVNVLYKGALSVDKWLYLGSSLYKAYDTNQEFMDNYPHGVYSLIPPGRLVYKSLVQWSYPKIMQLTRIVWRKYSRVFCFGSGFSICAALVLFYGLLFCSWGDSSAEVVATRSLPDYLHESKIVGYVDLPGVTPSYRFLYKDTEFTSDELLQDGFDLKGFGDSRVQVSLGGKYVYITK